MSCSKKDLLILLYKGKLKEDIMDKLVGVLVVCGLVLVIFLGVFQGILGGDIKGQGESVGGTLTEITTRDASRIGQDSP